MLKKVLMSAFTVLSLGVILSLTTGTAEAANNIKINETGNVLLIADQEKADGITAVQLSLKVDPVVDADVYFEFNAENDLKITEYRYHDDTNCLNIYIADSKPLFDGEEPLDIGAVSAMDLDGNAVDVQIAVVEDSLKYVYQTTLMEDEFEVEIATKPSTTTETTTSTATTTASTTTFATTTIASTTTFATTTTASTTTFATTTIASTTTFATTTTASTTTFATTTTASTTTSTTTTTTSTTTSTTTTTTSTTTSTTTTTTSTTTSTTTTTTSTTTSTTTTTKSTTTSTTTTTKSTTTSAATTTKSTTTSAATTAKSTTTSATTTAKSTTTSATTTTKPTTTTTAINNGHIASDDDLCKWALNDYKERTDIAAANAELIEDSEGMYEITLSDEEGKVLDIYTIDPDTGTGTNSANEEVNLPQTGNSSMKQILIVLGALTLIGLGFYIVKISGVIRRKGYEK